jgi:hypothetical protein
MPKKGRHWPADRHLSPAAVIECCLFSGSTNVHPCESEWTSTSEANVQIAGFPAILGEAFHPVPINPCVAKKWLETFVHEKSMRY